MQSNLLRLDWNWNTMSKLVGSVHAKFVCACAVACACVCLCVYLFTLTERTGVEGCGLWVKGAEETDSGGVCGLQPLKYTRLIKQHWAQDRTLRVSTDPLSPPFSLTLPLLFHCYLNINKRWIPTSPWGGIVMFHLGCVFPLGTVLQYLASTFLLYAWGQLGLPSAQGSSLPCFVWTL